MIATTSIKNASVPDPSALTALMSDLRGCFRHGAERIADQLPTLLDRLRGFRLLSSDELAPEPVRVPPVDAMATFLDGVREPLGAVDASGLLCDPWAAAALRRDEVRNASVLRWFLDPRGGHGCGDAMLTNLLSQVDRTMHGDFPVRPSARCRVSVEECPDGDRASRVDIQADDPSFFLVVEVKIDASEQPGQLARYCDVAAARATSARPWAVVFLTLDGRPPTTAGGWADHVIAVSWKHMAAWLRQTVHSAAPVPRFLATSFATHIDNL